MFIVAYSCEKRKGTETVRLCGRGHYPGRMRVTLKGNERRKGKRTDGCREESEGDLFCFTRVEFYDERKEEEAEIGHKGSREKSGLKVR